MRSTPKPRSAFNALLLLGLVAACSDDAPPSASPGAGLSRLDLGAVRLLPAAGIDGPPTSSAVPAFDRPYVDLAPGASASLGTTRDGYLVGGVPIPAAEALAARPLSVSRGAVYATPAVVRALGRAAARVAGRWPGSVLWAGDASARDGGDLPNHVSHNSGRDVDLAFFRRDPDGALGDTPTMTVVGADLSAAGGQTFDLARNWELVAALLEDPEVEVQWIFVVSYLREALLRHAREAEADPELVARAEAVLAQPSGSSPHAEHFHVRVYCGVDERLAGCLDAAPFHPWVDRGDAELARLVDGVVPFLERGWSDELVWAVERLVRLDATAALDHLERLRQSPDERVAALASDAVDFLRRRPGHGARASWEAWRVRDGALED